MICNQGKKRKQTKSKQTKSKQTTTTPSSHTNQMEHLRGLNEEQRLAVTAPLNGQLQVIAGPGTG